jgi:hypothetical protein
MRAVTPPEQQGLLVDLFARNTFWDLRTFTVSAEPVGPARDDRWRVTLAISVGKESVARDGRTTARPLAEPIEVGVYAPDTDAGPGKLLYLRKHALHVGDQRVVVLVHGRPGRAGLDPRNVLIDTKRWDNTRKVAFTGR